MDTDRTHRFPDATRRASPSAVPPRRRLARWCAVFTIAALFLVHGAPSQGAPATPEPAPVPVAAPGAAAAVQPGTTAISPEGAESMTMAIAVGALGAAALVAWFFTDQTLLAAGGLAAVLFALHIPLELAAVGAVGAGAWYAGYWAGQSSVQAPEAAPAN